MTIINIYNNLGDIVDSITIAGDLKYSTGRVCSSSEGVYYKGAGCAYDCNVYLDIDNLNIESEDEFCGFFYVNPKLEGKFGIFQERKYSWYDEIMGACGARELNLVPHSVDFSRSDVTVLDHVIFDKKNNYGYYKVLYKSHRISYIANGSPNKLVDLMEYMLSEQWNFPWDKDSINDISYLGLITDVADLFRSAELSHQLGSIYSILHTLQWRSFSGFLHLMRYLGFCDRYLNLLPVISLDILSKFGVSASYTIPTQKDLYSYIVGGRNFFHCGSQEYGDKMRLYYLKKLDQTENIIKIAFKEMENHIHV